MTSAAVLNGSDSTFEGLVQRSEQALHRQFACLSGPGGPPLLREALRYAVFSGGGRLRPSLCLAVAASCGDLDPVGSEAAAASIELMHCASLVHDDLPCFDDADLRRGKPTVHSIFGVPLAVLAGDALIVLAFGALARGGLPNAISALFEASGPARGVVAGQAWESEPSVPLEEYHLAKTSSLFAAAAELGALAAGGDAPAWRPFGEVIGRAYQAADDVVDASGSAARAGKPVHRDAVLGRPSVVQAYGMAAARRRVERLLKQAGQVIPPCPGEPTARAWLDGFVERLQASLFAGTEHASRG
jgi:geranylgeranyl diphosphate synthase type II